jgi:hypothetical protein
MLGVFVWFMIDCTVRLAQVRERLNWVTGISSGTRGCDGRFRLVKISEQKSNYATTLLG